MNLGTMAPRRLASGLAVAGTILLVGGLAACSDDDSDEVLLEPAENAPAGEGGQEDPEEPTGQANRSLTGTWEGTFQCGEEETGLTLALDDRGDGSAAASLEYHPLDGGGGSTGRYSMEGTLIDGQLSLTGQDWQEPLEEDGGGDRPMVGLEAAVDGRADTESLEGTVVGEGCTTFAAERVSTDPWYVGSFTGGYGCNQGLTSLVLTIEDVDGQALTATFEFGPHPDNPDVPTGSYLMEGNYVDGEMILHGVEWIDQPQGYVMVDLRLYSELGVDPHRIYGIVQAPGVVDDNCSLFTVARQEGSGT